MKNNQLVPQQHSITIVTISHEMILTSPIIEIWVAQITFQVRCHPAILPFTTTLARRYFQVHCRVSFYNA